MQKYIQDLIFNIEPIIEPITNYCSGPALQHINIPNKHVNLALIQLLREHGIQPISTVQLFYTPPNKQRLIHIDDFPGGNYVKLLWQTGGKDSLMRWYEPKNKDIIKKPSITVVNTRYTRFDNSEVNYVASFPIGYPSIVQVGVPHDIINFDEPRYVLSIMLCDMNRNRLTMDVAINVFSKFIANHNIPESGINQLVKLVP